MSKKSYERLEEKIERYERRKGYSTKRASYIAHAAAGKVARERRKTRRNPGLLFGLSLAQLALAGGAAVVAAKVLPTLAQQTAQQRAIMQAGGKASGVLRGTAVPGQAGGVVGNIGF